LRHRLGEFATLSTDRIKGDVLAVDFGLVFRQHLAGGLGVFEDVGDDWIKRAVGVQLGVRPHLDVDAKPFGISLQQCRKVGRIRLAFAKRVRNRGVGFAEIPAQRARVDLTQANDLTISVGEFPWEFAEWVFVIACKDLYNLVAAVS